MTKSSVSIVKTCRNPQFPEIKAKVREALDLIGGVQDIIKPDSRVIVICLIFGF